MAIIPYVYIANLKLIVLDGEIPPQIPPGPLHCHAILCLVMIGFLIAPCLVC